MATATVPTEAAAIQEPFKALAMTGPHKGQVVTVVPGAVLNGDTNGEAEPQLTPEEEAMLEFAVEAMRRMAESAKAASASMDLLLEELRDIDRRLHGSDRKSI
jgi:hypothetical protein